MGVSKGFPSRTSILGSVTLASVSFDAGVCEPLPDPPGSSSLSLSSFTGAKPAQTIQYAPVDHQLFYLNCFALTLCPSLSNEIGPLSPDVGPIILQLPITDLTISSINPFQPGSPVCDLLDPPRFLLLDSAPQPGLDASREARRQGSGLF